MYGVSCLAMLANFLSGLELPAREVAELGAAETNEMSRLDIPSFQVTQWWPGQYLERRPWLTITGWALVLCFTFQPISASAWRQEGGPAPTSQGGDTRLAWPTLYQPPHTGQSSLI